MGDEIDTGSEQTRINISSKYLMFGEKF